jgi:aryl-alcohol dehydrogenase-like predicted oxidoreductase/predicted dehydrogenase
MSKTLRWGSIGAGGIARLVSTGIAHSRTGKVVAVASTWPEEAETFAEEFAEHFATIRAHETCGDLLADPDVDAVHIAMPHAFHAKWSIRAAEAGKHVLLEKPIGFNHAEAMAIVEAARRSGVFLMEAYMNRCHPLVHKLIELLKEKAVGDVRVVRATFSFHAGFDPEHRLYSNALGGGGILDVGGYATSMAGMVAGLEQGKEFLEPTDVEACGHLGPTGVDHWSVCIMKFPGDVVAQLAAGVGLTMDNAVHIFGDKGDIYVPKAWRILPEGGRETLILSRKGSEPEEIVVETDAYLWALEADAFGAHVEKGLAEPEFPAMSWEASLANIRMMDTWRERLGLVYDRERFDARAPTFSGRPLRVREPVEMAYGRIPGVEKQVSRLLMGVDNQHAMPHASAMFDDFFERGGNAFDSAHIYGGGLCEKALGEWVAKRGVRDQVVLLDKGAHTPHCDPEGLTRQFRESLDRLQTDYVDIYMMHRDNPEVPVGEFVDVLNEHAKAGRMRAFGGSNWSPERIEAANAYAEKHGLVGFAAVSNNFSLARMVEPVWAGCISSAEPELRAWHERTQMPLLAWSSQARGFFTDRAGPEKRDDEQLVRCWYADDNFRRRERAVELARKKGVLPIAVALAYVLCQPFPTFALIGPRRIVETRTSMEGLGVELTPEELAWLNLED